MKMKNVLAIVLISLAILAMSVPAMAAAPAPEMPRILANARFVYVTSYDGGQFNPEILPEDRDVVSRVEAGIHKWGKLTLVYRLSEADVIVAVQNRPSEDVLAVYDAHHGFAGSAPSQTYLWRVSARGGLHKGEMPLLSQFEQAWDKIAQ
jgi:hypothetical protein